MRIDINDARKAGFCVAGVRSWFHTHELNFADFLKNGIEEDIFLAQGDDLAQRVVDLKRERENG